MHIFPQLRKLERKYASELVVVGVHSAKFPTEKETDSLIAAVRRCELEHPVINDAEFQVWQQYSCRAWPTLMFIDPRGNVIGKHEGELTFEQSTPLCRAWCRSSTSWASCNALHCPPRRLQGRRATSASPARCWRTRPVDGCSSPTPTTTG